MSRATPWPSLFPYTTLFRSWPRFGRMHPFAPVEQAQGYAEIFRELEARSEEHTSELQSLRQLVCRLQLEKKNEKLFRQEKHRLGISIPNVRYPERRAQTWIR